MKSITRYLRQTNKSQAQLARDCGMAATSINNLLKGRRSAGLVTLRKLAKGTGLSIEELVKS